MKFVKDESGFGVCEVVTPEELEVYIGYRNQVFPEQPTCVEEVLSRESARPKDCFHSRRLLSWEDDVVGCLVVVDAFWQTKESCFEVMSGMLTEDPELLDKLVGYGDGFAIENGAKHLATWQNDRRPAILDAFQRAGYVEAMRNPETELKLAEFDEKPFMEAVERFQRSGLRTVTLDQLVKSDPDGWLKRYWDAEWEMMQDVPLPFELKKDPIEVFEKMVEARKDDWEWTILVLDGEDIVATSGAERNKVDPTLFRTGLTSTKRSHRRQGIAKAIKVINLVRMRESGGLTVTTDNEQNNPMLDLNYQLGFSHARSWYVLERTV